MTASAARVCAQAKINLSLRVLAREESGYHQLETIFLRIDAGDMVTVRVGGDRRVLNAGDVDLGPVEHNLAMRAALAYRTATGWPDGFEIDLEKRIPVGAGLGGGSADAGAVLRCLDALAPTPVGRTALIGIAGALGADVPFLALDAPCALAWGRGERMLELPGPPARSLVIVVPPFAVATADAYRWLTPPGAADPRRPVALDLASLTGWPALEALAGNDFEPVVAERHPEITEIIGVLRSKGARVAQLTGSGSAVIGIFDGALSIDEIAPAVDGEVIPTRTAARVVGVDLLE